MENVLLQACVYLSATIIAVPFSKRLGLGSVLGYLIAGVLISPILRLVGSNTESIQHYAEFGIVIMLFLIGLEMQPKKIWAMRENLLGLGGLQIILTTAVLTFCGLNLDLSWQTSLAAAMILSLSSTAIVLQILSEKNLKNSEGGKSGVAILLMQDIAVIPILAFLPLLAMQDLQVDALVNAVITGEEIEGTSINASLISQLPGWAGAIAVASAIVAVILAGRYLTEPIIKYISRYGIREIFLAATFLMIISVAYLMTVVGLSPALGTFLVGLVLSNSQYRHALASDLDPFKGLLLGLFFITVGAGINFPLLFENLIIIISLTIGIISIKACILFILAKVFLLKEKSALLIALSLSQVGEFGFVLLALAKTAHVLPIYVAENLAVIIALSMLLTPILFFILEKTNVLPFKIDSIDTTTKISKQPRIIIIGMSRFGQLVSDLLSKHNHDTMILDSSSEKISTLRKKGIKGFFGDAENPNLLSKAGIETCEVVILAISDVQKSVQVADHILKKYPDIKLIARAIDESHFQKLFQCGAHEIILETFDSSVLAGQYALEALGQDRSLAEKNVETYKKKVIMNRKKQSQELDKSK